MACSLSCGDVAAPGRSDDVALLQITDYTSTFVTTFTGCFVRLRFKTSGESTNADVTIDEDNIDISVLGRRSIPAGGTSLMNVAPGFATYTRVEIDLEDNCGTSSSLNITNTHGRFRRACSRPALDRYLLEFGLRALRWWWQRPGAHRLLWPVSNKSTYIDTCS